MQVMLRRQTKRCLCGRSLWAVLLQTCFVQFCMLVLSPTSLCFRVISLSYLRGRMCVSAAWRCLDLPAPPGSFHKAFFPVLSGAVGLPEWEDAAEL